MSEKNSYSGILTAKNGKEIPFCKKNNDSANIALHSTYNPEREAESFAQNADGTFFIVLGLAGGYHIASLLKKCPESKVIVIETNDASISFLKAIPAVQELLNDRRVIPTTIERIEEAILKNYKPALHGNLSILTLRQWENLFSEEAELCRASITKTIKLLSADYSVQSHFGKIWQKNILSNLRIAEKTMDFSGLKDIFDTKKTAAIIAAGPSLDYSIKELKEDRSRYAIFATDTAYTTLCKHGIKSDAVISVDAQNVSHEHYMEDMDCQTVFAFDLCAQPSSARRALSKTNRVLFFETGHPLAQYASLFAGKRSFVHLEAGSGTVTIAAASLARTLGFKNLVFYGADFAYIGGRPYARGTYLENKFYSQSNRFSPAESSYTKLMFRTDVKETAGGTITTEILEAYKNSLKVFMKNHNPAKKEEISQADGQFNFAEFKKNYISDLKKCFRSEHDFDESSYAFTTLLPLCANLGKSSAFIAYLKTLRYTESI